MEKTEIIKEKTCRERERRTQIKKVEKTQTLYQDIK